MVGIWILIFEVSIILLQLFDTILYRLLGSIIIIRTILILNLVKPVASIPCISSISKCFRPHHVLFHRINLVIACSLLLWTGKLVVTSDLKLRPLMFSLIQGEHRI